MLRMTGTTLVLAFLVAAVGCGGAVSRSTVNTGGEAQTRPATPALPAQSPSTPQRDLTRRGTATSSHNTGLSATAPLTIVSVGFAAVSNMAVPRSGHTATLLADGRALVAGGTTDTTHSADLFDPNSSSLVPTTGGMLYTRTGHCAVLLPNGRVLMSCLGSTQTS
jgi:hypothetical protein